MNGLQGPIWVTSDSELLIRRIFEIFPFLGDAAGDRVRSALRGRSLAFCEKFSGQDDI
jgi:hypothetical protein